MGLEPMDPGVLRQRAAAGEFDAILGEVLTAPTWLDRQFGSQSFLGYREPRVAELIARAGTSLDPDETDAIYAELGTILRADLPVTALFPDYEMHVVHRRVRGLSSPWRSVPLRHMEELSFEEADESSGR